MKMCPFQECDRSQLVELWNRSARFDRITTEWLAEKIWGDAAELAGQDFSTEKEEISLSEHNLELWRAAPSDCVELERLLVENWPAWSSEAQVALGNDPPS